MHSCGNDWQLTCQTHTGEQDSQMIDPHQSRWCRSNNEIKGDAITQYAESLSVVSHRSRIEHRITQHPRHWEMLAIARSAAGAQAAGMLRERRTAHPRTRYQTRTPRPFHPTITTPRLQPRHRHRSPESRKGQRTVRRLVCNLRGRADCLSRDTPPRSRSFCSHTRCTPTRRTCIFVLWLFLELVQRSPN